MEATTNSTESHTKLQLDEEEEGGQQQQQQQQLEAPQTATATTATAATIIDIPAAVSFASSHSSFACSSYDTDCSTASSTCCTRQGEHIYMQHKLPATTATCTSAAAAAASTTAAAAANTATTCNMPPMETDELMMLKFEHRKHWPWFILMISVIEVSRRHWWREGERESERGIATFHSVFHSTMCWKRFNFLIELTHSWNDY